MVKGSYVLIIEVEERSMVNVGKLGEILFNKGFYCYVGSALKGLEARLNRHIKRDKKKHWHIDYLLERSILKEVYYIESHKKLECEIARQIHLDSIPGFGSSDCKCESHLFFSDSLDTLKDVVEKALKMVGSVIHHVSL